MYKNKRYFFTDWILIVISVIVFLTVLLMPVASGFAYALSKEEQQLLSAYQTGNLIRLHIVANSDSEFDQAAKLHIRDAVIDAFGKQISLLSDQSSNAVFHYLEKNLLSIEQEAREAAKAFGYRGNIEAQVGYMHLPEKQYGNVILPQGEYRALRIVLGNGEGQNWWCVLYPQLCLALSQAGESKDLTWSTSRIISCWLLLEQ